MAFFGTNSLEELPTFDFHQARKSTSYSEVSPPLTAWLHQARRVAAPLIPTGHFSKTALGRALVQLKEAARSEEGVSQVPSILSSAGIRFVIVEHLPKTRLDGACFWLADGSPVIAMSMRYERIDHFWHTLFHELGHISARDGFHDKTGRPDTDLPGSHTPVSADRPQTEVAADTFAARALIPEEQLKAFIAMNRPLYSRRKILIFADQVGVHPGIVVGQLQYRGEILYSHSRDLLVSVRDIVTANARTDGWKRSA
jgi:HTH-type transcriptional regulator/antitoxin HigA